MIVTLILAVALPAVVAGILVWLYERPVPDISMTEEEWEALRASDYEAWRTADPGAAWFMVRRDDDGLYYLSFMFRRGAKRFRKRWLPLSQTRLR